ncbi:hypothetical protein [Parasitella parasitica]|uniref:Uncharacterized protein n=1 Tax=Parasitella parasitica TaxID=35722 RepID=A0A0B7N004_9FUNG|nr:hypothetical protein [Parasitella parasitica]
MAEDYLYKCQQDPKNATAYLFEISTQMFEHCLLELSDILADHSFDLKPMEGFKEVFPAAGTLASNSSNDSNTNERMHAQLYIDALAANDPDQLPFNESQSIVYSTMKASAFLENSLGPRVFFVDGPG